MVSQHPNKAGYASRMKFVSDLLTSLKLAPQKIEPVAYDEEYAFPYNNFVFIFETDSQITAENWQGSQPGTAKIPPGFSKFVLRLPNSASNYNHEIRVENEVAALTLGRQALGESLVPRVFAWGSAAGSQQGWMLQEFMSGRNLRDDFPKMSLENQQKILLQMADIFKDLQRFQIPSTIRGYGGLTFDSEGQIIIGPLSSSPCGPFETYEDMIAGVLDSKLAEADQNKWIAGWKEKNIRVRLDKFIQEGLKSMMKGVVERKQTLVHADFTTDNLLYDQSTMRITAVIDFDFGHIGTVADEFFYSLGYGIGNYPDPRDGEETLPLSKAMLSGFPDPLPASTDKIQWVQAKIWDDALRDRNMYCPGNIQGMETLSRLSWFTTQLLPFKLSWEIVIQNSGEHMAQLWKESGQELLDEFLSQQGF